MNNAAAALPILRAPGTLRTVSAAEKQIAALRTAQRAAANAGDTRTVAAATAALAATYERYNALIARN